MISRHRNLIQLAVALLLAGQLVWASTVAGAAAQQQQRPILSVAVVGDQNTAGINNQEVWPTLMAARNGWSVSNFALPEAGFAAEGTGGQSFSYQVDRAQADHPDVILLVTGTADASLPGTEGVTVGAADAINKIIRRGQQVAVVGPIWYELPIPDSIRHVNDAVQKVAGVAGVPFLNTIDPPLLTRELMHSNLSGPSDAGQSLIADTIAAWLRTQVTA
jgi:lysophospholipase L1-like esterase